MDMRLSLVGVALAVALATTACGSSDGGSSGEDASSNDTGTNPDGNRTNSDGSQQGTPDSATSDAASSSDGTAVSDGTTGSDGPEPTEASPDVDSGPCTDKCPMTTGLTHGCEQRFALGANYAWKNFSTDFGGLAAWSQLGVSQNSAAYDADLAKMHSNGVSVIRWWIFPDFRGSGVTFDSDGNPTGITATAKADIQEALALAKKDDVYLVFTIFSFDGFKPTYTTSGVTIPTIQPMVANSTQLTGLIGNVVKPVAEAAGASPDVDHLLGWDIINEPEWAIAATGAPGVSGQDFAPNSDLTPVTLAQMTALITGAIPVLKAATPNALTSVGWAATKWSWAFTSITSLDFNQPHIYGWVDEYWPYTLKPTALGYPAKPTVYGEFYLAFQPFASDAGGTDPATYATILSTWWTNGFAGAWGWSFSSASADLPLIETFATLKGCPAGF